MLLSYDRAVTAIAEHAEGKRAKLRAALRLPEPLAVVALFVLANACAALMLIRPREVAPIELPNLVLDAAAVARVIAADAQAASTAPRSPQSHALRALMNKQGEMELVGTERVKSLTQRREALAKGFAELVAASSEDEALRLRAEATQELEAALDLKLPLARAKVVVGALGQMLQREGASVDGQLTAPRFVVRTLYKARWNLLHGLRPDHRFERIERQAYFGWQALHAERLPLPQRAEALRSYAKAGGWRGREALGVLYFLHDDFVEAVGPLTTAHEAAPSVRVRNYLLGAEARANAL